MVAEDLLGVLKIFISKSYFSEADYNRALKRHTYASFEASDKPEPIDVKKRKLRGKAFSILCHIRNVGFYFDFINPNIEIYGEESFKLFRMLSSIVEVVMAPVVRKYEIAMFEEEVIHYLNLRKKIYEQYPCLINKPKPKTHYLSHYGESFIMYGPSVGVCTSRYESKHRTAKMLATSSKNFVNIAKTLARRQQYRQSSVYYNGMFDTDEIHLPADVKRKEDLEDSPKGSSFHKIFEFMDDDSILSNEVMFRNQMYGQEDVVVLKVLNKDHMYIGVIKGVLLKQDVLYFLVSCYEVVRDMNLRYFVTVDRTSTNFSFVMSSRLADYKPLIKYGTSSKFKVTLHHHISISMTD